MKRILIAFVILLVSVNFAFAGGHGKKKGLSGKLCKKVHFLMMNQENLGITDEQMDTIMSVATEAKKKGILKKAEVDVIKVDIKKGMMSHQIDLETLNPLIDKKYAAKAEYKKILVKALADIMGVLSKEQHDKMKKLCFAQKAAACGKSKGCGAKKGCPVK